jgi:hypothetical protein
MNGGRHGRDCMVVGFTTTYAISVYDYYKRVEFESRSWQCVLESVDTIFINPRSDNHFFWVDKSSCPPYQNSLIV